VQKAQVPKEWNSLNNKEPIPKSSALKALNPKLGGDLLLRLGERLRNAARIFRKTSCHIAAASHLQTSHRPCASCYSLWWHAIYAALLKTRLLDYRRSQSRQGEYPSMCDMHTSSGAKIPMQLIETRLNLNELLAAIFSYRR